MNIKEAAEAAYAGSEVGRAGASIGLIFSPEAFCLVYNIPGMALSSRKFTPSYSDLIATDWEAM